MKKIALMLLALSLSACGLYTNIPAQVKVGSVPSGASVKYTVNANSVAAEVENPTVTLVGEPGSIGVTYETVVIEYLPNSLPLEPRAVTLASSVRVPSSHNLDENGNAVPGRAEVVLPIISSQIQNLGNPSSQNRVSSQISAKVTLSGNDDAGYPAELIMYVPINFTTVSSSTAVAGN